MRGEELIEDVVDVVEVAGIGVVLGDPQQRGQLPNHHRGRDGVDQTCKQYSYQQLHTDECKNAREDNLYSNG